METAREKDKNKIISMGDYRFQVIGATIKYLKERHQLEHVKNLGLGFYGAVIEIKRHQMRDSVAAKIVLQESVSESETTLWPVLKHENLLPLLSAKHIPSTYSYVFITPQHHSTKLWKIQLSERVSTI